MSDEQNQALEAFLQEHPEWKGNAWTTDQMSKEFTVECFTITYPVVIRKSDGKRGHLDRTTTSPRIYFDFIEIGK